MPINELIAFCESLYQKNGKCKTCAIQCDNSCNMCLQSIHNDQANLREYDCANMTNCYTCSYINKYASEIYYTFQALVSHPSTQKTEYNILSIGCGDCADIFGINEFLKKNGRDAAIFYTGVDKNQNWKSVHEKIEIIFPEIIFKFIYTDVFDFIDTTENVTFNIIILEYVLNEIRKYSPDDVDTFIDKLAHNIIDRIPPGSLVIINDINHYMVRNYYPALKKEVIKNNSVLEAYLRFKNPTSHVYGGAVQPEDHLVFETHPDSIFDEKFPCSSCIYVLFKQ